VPPPKKPAAVLADWLVLNSGSSSVKFALLVPGSGERHMEGMGERLGTPEALLRVQWFPAAAVEERLPGGTHQAVVARVLDHLAEAGLSGTHLLGAGHRVVHGGEQFSAADKRQKVSPMAQPLAD
jgi:acetate kinase